MDRYFYIHNNMYILHRHMYTHRHVIYSSDPQPPMGFDVRMSRAWTDDLRFRSFGRGKHSLHQKGMCRISWFQSCFIYFHPYLRKWSNLTLTNIFPKGLKRLNPKPLTLNSNLAIVCELFRMVTTWSLQRLSDLQIGDKKVTAWITWKLIWVDMSCSKML